MSRSIFLIISSFLFLHNYISVSKSSENINNNCKLTHIYSLYLEESLRNIRGIYAVYEHFLSIGDIERSSKAALSLITYARGRVIFLNDKIDISSQKLIGRIDVSENGRVSYCGQLNAPLLLAAAQGLQDGRPLWRNLVSVANRIVTSPLSP